MTTKKYIVELTDEERTELEAFVSAGEHPAEAITRARILLKADQGWTDEAICEALDCGQSTPFRTRKRFSEVRTQAVQRRPPDRVYQRAIDGHDEAHLIALACREPPAGRDRWSLRLLADRFVALDEVSLDEVSYQTVRRTLKKHAQALETAPVGDSADPERWVRRPDGGPPRPISPTLRSRVSGRMRR